MAFKSATTIKPQATFQVLKQLCVLNLNIAINFYNSKNSTIQKVQIIHNDISLLHSRYWCFLLFDNLMKPVINLKISRFMFNNMITLKHHWHRLWIVGWIRHGSIAVSLIKRYIAVRKLLEIISWPLCGRCRFMSLQ